MQNLVKEGILEKEKPWSEVSFFKSKVESDKKIMVSEVFKISPVIKEMILNNSSKKRN